MKKNKKKFKNLIRKSLRDSKFLESLKDLSFKEEIKIGELDRKILWRNVLGY